MFGFDKQMGIFLKMVRMFDPFFYSFNTEEAKTR